MRNIFVDMSVITTFDASDWRRTAMLDPPVPHPTSSTLPKCLGQNGPADDFMV
ncbi:MAG TPA: hypothetical protein VMU81_16895 [Acetobacteraceae bacterium]|nr:hypothetical protein [Acetobacteraceae bacterium]